MNTMKGIYTARQCTDLNDIKIAQIALADLAQVRYLNGLVPYTRAMSRRKDALHNKQARLVRAINNPKNNQA